MAAGRRMNIRDFERSAALSTSDVTWASHFAQLLIDATYTASVLISTYDTTRRVNNMMWERSYQNFQELWMHSRTYLPVEIKTKADNFFKKRYTFIEVTHQVMTDFISLFLDYTEAIHRSERLMAVITENKICLDREEKPNGIYIDPLRKN